MSAEGAAAYAAETANDDAPVPEFGGRVRVRLIYRRVKHNGMRERKMWSASQIAPREALYIGWRTISDGVNDWDDYGANYAPTRHFRAALVVFSERERPVLAPFDALEVL